MPAGFEYQCKILDGKFDDTDRLYRVLAFVYQAIQHNENIVWYETQLETNDEMILGFSIYL